MSTRDKRLSHFKGHPAHVFFPLFILFQGVGGGVNICQFDCSLGQHDDRGADRSVLITFEC